jgi:hypothetical protein
MKSNSRRIPVTPVTASVWECGNQPHTLSGERIVAAINRFKLPLALAICCVAWPTTVAGQLMDAPKDRHALDELRQHEFESMNKKIVQDFNDKREREEQQRKAAELRRRGMHHLVDGIFYLVFAAFAIYAIVRMSRRRRTNGEQSN